VDVSEIRRKLISHLPSNANFKPVLVSSPSRVDFLNTHQDYKGLPVVPVAINLRCYVAGVRGCGGVVNFTSLNIPNGFDSFSIGDFNLIGGGWFGDYVRAVFKSMEAFGFKLNGINIVLWSEIPMGSGLASSAALEVSIIKLVSEIYGLNLDRHRIAELAYFAEHDVMGIPCGRLDQYACSYGGVILLDPKPPCTIEHLPHEDLIFVVVDSGVHRRIFNVHPVRQAELNEALRILLFEVGVDENLKSKLSTSYDRVSWHLISEEDLKPYLNSIPKKLANRLIFTIKMNKSTIYAVNLIKGVIKPRFEDLSRIMNLECHVDFEDKLSLLGLIVNYQHELLRDYYDVSLPILEDIRRVMIDNGALGAKISGAGLGGAIIGLVRDEGSAERVCKACIDRGFPMAFYSRPSEGVRVEYRF
jgi:galactokinase